MKEKRRRALDSSMQSSSNAIFMYYPPERTPIPSFPTPSQGSNTRAQTQAGTKRAEQPPGLSCAACFEQLAGVLASCGAFPLNTFPQYHTKTARTTRKPIFMHYPPPKSFFSPHFRGIEVHEKAIFMYYPQTFTPQNLVQFGL